MHSQRHRLQTQPREGTHPNTLQGAWWGEVAIPPLSHIGGSAAAVAQTWRTDETRTTGGKDLIESFPGEQRSYQVLPDTEEP